ncbi:hypothetical protein [Micromonospora sp. NPDC047730]|uniref:hypothetical protein n=1 Tax=Micromonospora sp. NPDC047730 TaxID=3364253 RepID=UPI0037144D26
MIIHTFNGYTREVADELDDDGDLKMFGEWFRRKDVAALRDHLTTLLGDVPPADPDAVAVVKAAVEEVARQLDADTRFPSSTGVAFRMLARNLDVRSHL